MTAPTSLAVRVLAGIGALLLLFLSGVWAGHELATTQAEATNKRADAKALAQLHRAVADGETAAAALREQLQLQSRFHATLQERLRHAPLHVPARAAAPACSAAAAAPLVAGAAAVAGPPAPRPQLEPGAVDVELSLAAVSLWNSALAGADLDAGACRAADPTSAACAAAAGIGLAEAWANQAANAASCAADRARHQRLIDYLTAQRGPQP